MFLHQARTMHTEKYIFARVLKSTKKNGGSQAFV